MKKEMHITFTLLVIGFVAAITYYSNACGDYGNPQEPDPMDSSAELQAKTVTENDDPENSDNNGQDAEDPILLNTGEFLFERNDATVSGRGIQFPVRRIYRSRPSPLTRQTIGDGSVKLIVEDPQCGEDEWYADPSNPPKSNWLLFTWLIPPNDPYFPIEDVIFEINEGMIVNGVFIPDFSQPAEGVEIIDTTNDLNMRLFMPPSPPGRYRTGKAFRFDLWTGRSYQIHFKMTRKFYTWDCFCPYPICPSSDCDSCHDYALNMPNFLLYTDEYWAKKYSCGYRTNDYFIMTIEEFLSTVTIPEPPTGHDILPTSRPQPIPSPTECPLSRSIENYSSRINWTPGWDMSYNIHLDYIPDPNDEDAIYLYPGDGNVFTYHVDPQQHPVYGEIWTCPKREDFLKKWSNGLYTLYLKNNIYWRFNTKGYISFISENDQRIRFGYDPNIYGLADVLKLEYIEDNCGRKLDLIYTDPNGWYPGNLQKMVDHTGRVWSYDYYPDGNLKTVTDPNGFKETYEYDIWGRLTDVKDHAGNTWLTNTYDGEGRVHQQILGGPDGPDSHITYNPDGSRVVTDANGVDETFILNADGYALSRTIETETGSATTLYERDSKNELTKIVYPEQNGYDLTYDPDSGNLISVQAFSNDPADPNLVYALTYDSEYDMLTSVTDPRGNTVTYTYDHTDPNYATDRGLLMKITYPQVMTDTVPQRPEINFTYTNFNEIETITSPDGIVLKYAYWEDASEPNTLGLVKSVILDYGDPNDPTYANIPYEFWYNESGRIVDVNDPYGNTTTLTYNLLDLVEQVEDPAGNLTRLTYNSDKKMTKLEREFEGGWQTVDYGYNIMAKLTSITDSLGHTTTLEYDDRYQVKQVTDANQNATKKRYNTRQLLRQIVDAENGSTTLDYDDNGRLSVITDAEDADTVYDYDGYGRLEYVTYADDSYEQYGYDENGNLTSFRNRAGEVITFAYDALNRLVGKTRPGENQIVLTYDIAGRLVDVSQGTEQMMFDYDRLGRLEETTDQNGYMVGYDFDDMGRRAELTYPDNTSITYEYDDVGRLETIKDSGGYKIVEYIYDELSRTTDVLYCHSGSQVGSIQYDYEDKVPIDDDNLGSRIAQIDYCCNPQHSISYTYDAVGNITTMDVGGNYDWTYGYDNTYQVTWANQGSATNRAVDFTYDSVYNRTLWTDTLGSISVGYDDNAVNQYTQNGWRTPTYDARGNMTSIGQWWSMTYDCENRLLSAISGFLHYEYDLLGRRNRYYFSGGSDIGYVWDGDQIIAEFDSVSGSLIRKYIYGPGMDHPVAMINVDPQTQAETWYYYYADALGSIRLMTDASGYPVESYTYDVYGRPRVMHAAGADVNWLTEDVTTSNSSSIGNPYLFTGRRWDSAAEKYYYRFRDYDPVLGRFLQTDPAGYMDTMNLYAYCANNPINCIDPWGLLSKGQTPPEEPQEPTWFDRVIQRVQNWFEVRSYDITRAGGMSIGGATGIEIHHLLPREFEPFFRDAGLNIEDYTMELEKQKHRLKPNGIHTGKDNWNKEWSVFIENNPNATRAQILRQLERMKKKYGL